MKNIIAMFLVCALLVGGLIANNSFADNGTSTGNKTYTLMNSVAVTTAASVTSSAVTFDNPMKAIACDFVSSNITATGTWYIEGNAGSSTTLFSTGTISTISSKPAGTIYTYFSVTTPVRILRTWYNMATGSTNTITVNCLGVQ